MINLFKNRIIRLNLTSLIFIVLFFSFSSVFAQDPVMRFEGKAKDKSGKKMSGVTIKVYQNGNEVHSVTTGSNGKFKPYEADYGYIYKVVFSKDGYVSKSIEINGKDNFYEEDVEEVVGLPMEMGLFKRDPDVDYSPIESKPVGKYHIDKNTGLMDLDRVFTNSRKKEIDDFFKKLANASKDKDKKFTELVKAGDKALKKKNYKTAIKNWKAALDVKDDNAVAIKITDTEMLLDNEDAEKKLNEKFNQKIKEGDDLLAANKFNEAIAKYEEAQRVKPKEKLPKTKIKEVAEKRNNLEKDKITKKFNDLMAKAEKEITAKDYTNAIETLKQAKTIKPKEKSPNQKIKQINKIIDNQAKNKAKYESLIAAADNLFTTKSYKDAKAKYKEALVLISGEKHPANRIIEIDKLISEKEKAEKEVKAKKDEYNAIIKQADKELKNKKYTVAKESYKKALALFSTESYPKEKLTEIDNLLKQAEEEYKNTITQADKLLADKKYEEAIIKYEDALKLKKEETYPKTQITKANNLLAKEKTNKLNAKAKKEEYEKLIKQADKELKNKEYNAAKESYTKALSLFSTEIYPKEKLTEIDNLLKQAEEEYKNTITQADKLLANKKYEEAIAKYEDALKLKKEENYPKTQIKKANELIAKAKKDKLNANQLKKEYDNIIDNANKHFKAKKYKLAKESYTKASSLFNNEAYPKEQLATIEKILKKQEEEYSTLISNADKEMETEKYDQAISLYKKALEIKKNTYPNSQIEKAKKLISEKNQVLLNAADKEKKYNELKNQADKELSNQNLTLAKEKYQEALTIKPNAPEPKKQIEFIDEMIRKRKKRYDKYIAEADNLFSGNKFEVAIEKYEEAIWVMPVEQYPKDQIELARKKLEGKKGEALALANKEKKYTELIAKGNTNFNNENYLNAKTNYTGALKLKPTEQYPKDQLAIIEKKLKEIADKKALADKEANKDKNYNALILQADNNFDNSKYEVAKDLYKKAYAVKSEKYPQTQIDLINKKLAQLTQTKELQKQYDKIIAVADKKFNQKDYKTARNLYKRALGFKPSDSYPPLKLAEIDKIESELALANKLKEEEEARKNLLFNRLLKLGDDNFELKKYQTARDDFQEALDLKPSEAYPKQKIAELDVILTKIANEREKYKKFSDNYFDIDAEIYGEEVNMDSDDVNLIITNTEDKKKYRDYMNLRNYIDSMNTVDKTDIDRNINTTYLSYKDYERIQEEIIKDQGKNDYAREASITSFEIFREYHIKEKADRVKKAYEQNSEIANQINVIKEGIIEDNKEGQKSIEKNAKSYENLTDRLTNENQERTLNNIDKTSEIYNQTTDLKEKLITEQATGQESIERNAQNYEAYNDKLAQQKKLELENMINKTSEIANQTDELKEKIIAEHKEGQQTIEENASQYNNLNDRLANEHEEQNLKNIDKTSEIAQEVDDLKEKLIAEQATGQESIERNAQNYEAYNDKLAEQKKLESENMINKTSEIADQTDELKEKIIKETKEGQQSIEKNAKSYENLNDRLANEQQDITDKNTDKTSEIYNQTTNLKDKLIENHDDGQAKIEKNAKEYENYSDNLAIKNRKEAEKETRAGQEIANETDKLKEKIIAKNKAANLATEKNAIKYDNLNDRLTAEEKYKAEENQANTYRNSKEYENTKDNLHKNKSDEIVNNLAMMFPEGVTQKIYQRKNSFGEITEVTVRRIVVKGNKGADYRKTTNKSGSYYFKNGQPISSSTWDIETSGEIVNDK